MRSSSPRRTRPSTQRSRTPARRGTLATLVALLALALTVPFATADDRSELVREQEENERRQAELQSSLEGVETELAETYLDLEAARQRLPIAQQELADAEDDLAAAEAALIEAERDLAAAESRQEQVASRLELAESEAAGMREQIAETADMIGGTQAALGDLARSVYRGDHTTSTLDVVLGSASSADFLRSYSVTNTAVSSQTQVLRDLEEAEAVQRNQQERLDAVTDRVGELRDAADAAVADADQARADADTAVAAADQARDDAEAAKTAIETAQADATALAEQLENQQGEYQDQIARIESDQADLSERIAQIDEENRRERERQREREREREAERARQAEQAQRQSGSSGTAAPPAPPPPPPPASSAPNGSRFITPVPRPVTITSGFGWRIYPITGQRALHAGVDLRSACGQEQVAIADGVVAEVRPVGSTPTSGNQVLINHGVMSDGNSYISVTNHLSGFAVRAGQRVSQGQVVGYTGATGMVTGCHVHLEIWRNGTAIDPMTQL
ncbi:M23 family metallopeptidase [Bogoriella caseilytica]|uniref:Murein DD-endopeptidase MepM/ murein hydrolase activator NlpD n=1 Tax=Bogoriella caseilytica TaxID=56055 RepID=A0A3N2BEU1_9MICO|nr:M23 family metallopeptidase [Bogoriella caseilytica]ROR73735.1 murein DD-endopeptidase MepM/ murein hydrolase activator NlpD [Bogoriella caseilytica]